jgi:hypothetical protein
VRVKPENQKSVIFTKTKCKQKENRKLSPQKKGRKSAAEEGETGKSAARPAIARQKEAAERPAVGQSAAS